MAREDNLIPNSQRSPEELREMGKKGGIASGIARREKANFKNIVQAISDETMSNKKNYAENLARSVYAKGIKTGDVRYLVEIAKLLGQYEDRDENGTPTLEIKIVDNENKIKGESNE